jgi:hypothetical protein
MTKDQKYIVQQLFEGKYLVLLPDGYTMYEGNMSPVQRRVRLNKNVRGLLKADKKKRLTINLNQVRQLHGRSWIKKYYSDLKRKV